MAGMCSCSCEPSHKLITAIEDGSLADVSRVLDEAGHVVGAACGRLRVTPLLVAAARGEAGQAAVRLLLDRGAPPHVADKLGRTPLHLASGVGAALAVRWLLEAGAAPDSRFHVSRDHPDGVETHCGHPPRDCQLALPECWGRTPLHLAVKAGNLECVTLLLAAGADVNVCDEQGVSPLLLAGSGLQPDDRQAVSMFEELVEVLVAAGADVNARTRTGGVTVLHAAAALQSEKAARRLLVAGASAAGWPGTESPLHVAAASGCVSVVGALLDCGSPHIVNALDQMGHTPLHRAAFSGARQALALLLRRGGDLSAEDNDGITVADALFSYIPRPVHFLTEMLDSCIVTNSASINDKTFKVELDFGMVVRRGPAQQMSVLMAVVSAGSQPQLTILLQHPLLRAFLWFKWRKLRVFFFAVLAVHACFVLSLSVHAVARVCGPHSAQQVLVSRRLLLTSALFLLIHIVGQVLVVPRRTLKQFETWLNVVSTALALCMCVWGEVYDNNSLLSHTSWIRHVFSVLVLLAWAELMLLVGRFPTWGYYALMFYNVLQNVVKVLLTFVCLVIGFAFSFLIQFQENFQFSDLWLSLVKTTVMMTGEFDYGSLFSVPEGPVTQNSVEMSRLPITSRIIFFIFVILASIVLMNLMVGLAVSDIQALQTEGIVHRFLKQAAFIEQLEKISDRLIQIRFIPRFVRLILDMRRSIDTRVVIEPSSNSHSPNHLPYAILEGITLTGLSNQKQIGATSTSNGYSGTTYACVDDANTANVLHSIQHELSEVRQLLNMLLDAQQQRPLSVVPMGSANRFSQAVSGIHEVQNVLRSIRQGRKSSRSVSRA